MTTGLAMVDQATERIAAAGCETPDDDAKALVARALEMSVEQLMRDGTTDVSPQTIEEIEDWVRRRTEHEPLAYILGHEPFCGIDVAVDSRVLIPRRETGLLVEVAAGLPEGARVHEVGTGSGAVALALLSERPDLHVTASDLSPEAAEVARENAARLGLSLEVTVAAGLPDSLEGDVDLVLANLPYVTDETISDRSPEIRREPRIAVSHIHAVLLNERQSGERQSGAALPDAESLALVVSGGHTHLYRARPAGGTWSYTLVGRTLDDAAGEAYDKVAKLLGLGYPGGPWIDALARFGDPHAVPFAFAQIKTKVHLGGKTPRTKAAKTAPIAALDPHFLFSFSGIKTAVLRYVDLNNLREGVRERIAKVLAEPRPPQTSEAALALCPQPVLDLIASFQRAVVGDLLKKTFAAAESLGTARILVTGGVAANRELRERFTQEAARRGLEVAFPTLALSTDNAAMIAAAAWPRYLAGEFAAADLTAEPSLVLGR